MRQTKQFLFIFMSILLMLLYSLYLVFSEMTFFVVVYFVVEQHASSNGSSISDMDSNSRDGEV